MRPPIRLFICYANQDERLRAELEAHLAPLRDVAESWSEHCINPGANRQQEVDLKLAQADIVLLLISADFLATRYLEDPAVTSAVERHRAGLARVVPIILRETLWKGLPLGKLQVLPRNQKAVVTWEDRDSAWTDVVRGILQAITALTEARSQATGAGQRGLNRVHLHIDGSGLDEAFLRLVPQLACGPSPSHIEVTRIAAAVAGPQRSDYPETYQSHTPGIGVEQFEVFSTLEVGDRGDAITALQRIVPALAQHRGAVVEAEHVVGVIDEGGAWSAAFGDPLASIDVPELQARRAHTLPFEIHFGINIPRQDRSPPPFHLEQLLAVCDQQNIRVGGWFRFDKEDRWAYRSNQFAKELNVAALKAQHQALREHLLALVPHVTLWVMVERILGVWKMLGRPATALRRTLDLRGLARWEHDFPQLQRFWVVAPNFAGDQDQDVREAMIHNLGIRDVEYTYFLRSFADVQRLRQLARSLSEEVGDLAYQRIHAVLLAHGGRLVHSPHDFTEENCFIALPAADGPPEGFSLTRSPEGRINGGRAMTARETAQIIERLRRFIGPADEPQGLRIPLRVGQQQTPRRMLMCTDFVGSVESERRLGGQSWERILELYDFLVAEEASKADGEVVKNLGDGYLVLFADPIRALHCAQQVQARIERWRRQDCVVPLHRIALDEGPVMLVQRAQGPDVAGAAVARCLGLVQRTGAKVVLTTSFMHAARGRIGVRLDTLIESAERIEVHQEPLEVWSLRSTEVSGAG